MVNNKTIYRSFSALARGVLEEKIPLDSIKGALFYFGCAQDFVLDEDAVPVSRYALGKDDQYIPTTRQLWLLEQLRFEVIQAEDQDRVKYAKPEPMSREEMSVWLTVPLEHFRESAGTNIPAFRDAVSLHGYTVVG